MTTLRAHFDGRFLVPDEPVNLLPGQAYEVELREIEQPRALPSPTTEIDSLTGLPVFKVPPGTKTITSAEVQRELDEP